MKNRILKPKGCVGCGGSGSDNHTGASGIPGHLGSYGAAAAKHQALLASGKYPNGLKV